MQTCGLYCQSHSFLVRLTVTDSLSLLSLVLLKMLSLAFFVGTKNSTICTHLIALVGTLLILGPVQLSCFLLLVGMTSDWAYYCLSEFWPMVVWWAIHIEAFGISSWFGACFCWTWLLEGSIWLVVGLVHLVVILSVCLGSFCVILFL